MAVIYSKRKYNKRGAPFSREGHRFVLANSYLFSLSIHKCGLVGVGTLHIEAMDECAIRGIAVYHT